MITFPFTGISAGPASRKDLLAVQELAAVTVPDPEWVLRGLGFETVRQAPDHWVLTRDTPLPELHFYSYDELARFAGNRAWSYRLPVHGHSDHTPGVVFTPQPHRENAR